MGKSIGAISYSGLGTSGSGFGHTDRDRIADHLAVVFWIGSRAPLPMKRDQDAMIRELRQGTE
jgi:hypothetical protein